MLYNGFPDQEKYEYSGYYEDEEWGRSLRSANEFQIESYDNHATLQEMSDCTMDDWRAGEQENLRFFIKRILGGITINQLISALGILTHLEWSGGLSLRFILVQRKMGSWS